MSMSFENSGLWLRTLAPQENDLFADQRGRLRSAYMLMREHAADLVKMIPLDCRGLTVHDISHLDALWETADAIAGPDFNLTPAEAFVFGCSVLIHDAGMSIAAFPGGMNDITGTPEWSDIVYSLYRRSGIDQPKRESIFDPPLPIKEEAIFSTIRYLHAQQAEKLCSVQWTNPTSGARISLLQDQSLSTAYSKSIGQISHSHNWSIERLPLELRTLAGAASNLPPEWRLNEVKVACLLRCADAAHIDHRRAPTMLYALHRPEGFSDLHWRFQNKLNKITYDGDSLLYSSNADFEASEAPAWWLCYDTIRMINQEIYSSNAILQDIGSEQFKAKRVFGAENTRFLAKQIKTSGWRPVDAEIKVSHPAHLAETLGGKNLYGKGSYAPIRELSQNAADAIRARRRLEGRNVTWGQIKLSIESASSIKGTQTWLHIDDNGVGMTERVLVGPLIDFGKSLWNSSLMHEEFPGLDSKGYQAVGKFGIGFFSVFLLGKNVKVITKPYLSGHSDVQVLEFSSLSTRPIVRNAAPGELPVDFSTRISVQLNPDIDQNLELDSEFIRYRNRRERISRNIHEVISKDIRRLILSLDINVECSDEISGIKYEHTSKWEISDPDDYLRAIMPQYSTEIMNLVADMHRDLLSSITGTDGTIYGRAAIWMNPEAIDKEQLHASSLVSVGGFAYPSTMSDFYVGTFQGETDDVSRMRAQTKVPVDVMARWATEQADRIDQSRFSYDKLISAALKIVDLKGNPGTLPVCLLAGRMATLSELEATASRCDKIVLLLSKSTDESFNLTPISSLSSVFFMSRLLPNLVCLNGSAYSTTIPKEITRGRGRYPYEINGDAMGRTSDEFKFLIALLERVWAAPIKYYVAICHLLVEEFHQKSSPYWTLRLERGKSVIEKL